MLIWYGAGRAVCTITADLNKFNNYPDYLDTLDKSRRDANFRRA